MTLVLILGPFASSVVVGCEEVDRELSTIEDSLVRENYEGFSESVFEPEPRLPAPTRFRRRNGEKQSFIASSAGVTDKRSTISCVKAHRKAAIDRELIFFDTSRSSQSIVDPIEWRAIFQNFHHEV
jgi:hypothetical protein